MRESRSNQCGSDIGNLVRDRKKNGDLTVENPVPTGDEQPMSERGASEFQRRLVDEYPDVFQSKLTSSLKPIKEDDVIHIIKIKDPVEEKPSKGYYPVPHSIYTRAQEVGKSITRF